MIKYQVFENDKPCDAANHKVHKSWNNSIFDSFNDALKYVYKWIGEYADPDSMTGSSGIKVNIPYDYSGYGDMIEIREIQV
jgi:hypothetical protein